MLKSNEEMRVEELMTENPACCTPSTPLREVARMMLEHDCGAIPVVESERSFKPVGIITDRDIVCRAIAKDLNPLNLSASDCMTNSTIAIARFAKVPELLQAMEANQIRRIVVVDGNGNCCGIVSQADVARQGLREESSELLEEVSASHAH